MTIFNRTKESFQRIPFIANFTVEEGNDGDRRKRKRSVSSNQSTSNNFDDDFFDDEKKVDKKAFHPSVHMDPKTYVKYLLNHTI